MASLRPILFLFYLEIFFVTPFKNITISGTVKVQYLRSSQNNEMDALMVDIQLENLLNRESEKHVL